MSTDKATWWLDWYRRWKDLWDDAAQPVRTAVWSTVVLGVTVVVGKLSQWSPMDIWLASLAVGVGFYVVVRLVSAASALGHAYAHRLKDGPPPERPRISLVPSPGVNSVGVEVHNSGGTGTLRYRARILNVDGDRVFAHQHLFDLESGELKRGDTRVVLLAQLIGDSLVWVMDSGRSRIADWPVEDGAPLRFEMEFRVFHILDTAVHDLTTTRYEIYRTMSKGAFEIADIGPSRS